LLGWRGAWQFILAAWGSNVNIADCTVPEKILLAASQLEQEGQSPFSAEALIVSSWLKFPKTFGLKGYADQYPDSNKVLSSIMGEKGLARRGWLVKMGQKLYALTREGRHVVSRLAQGGETPTAAPASKVAREQEKFLLGLLNSVALEKYLENRKGELTFSDACRFWGINDSTHGDVLDARMSRVRAQLADLERLVGHDGLDLSDGRNVAEEEVAQLSKLHSYLEERFSRHLNLLRSRVERG
jgi:hypothetical protein